MRKPKLLHLGDQSSARRLDSLPSAHATRNHSAIFPLLNLSTAAAASYRTMSLLSSGAGVNACSKAGLPLLAIANTAAARIGDFLSEQALVKAASIS